MFAYSSDAIGFRQIDDGGFRQIATHSVTGTLDGSTILLRIAKDTGEEFEVDATVDDNLISGTYLMRRESLDGDAAVRETGEFSIERY
jgi:hypothetical protein